MRRSTGDRWVELVRTGRTPEELSREFECLAQGDPRLGAPGGP